MAVTLRPIRPEDEPFLISVYAMERAAELALVPWDDSRKDAFVKAQFLGQRDHYGRHFPGAEYQIILIGGEPAGRFYVYRGDGEIRILDLAILPRYRNRGAGTELVDALLAEAARSRKRLRIYVEMFNPSAAFFERKGFVKTESDGLNFLMIWYPEK